MWVAGHTHQLAMAARPAGANPPALKIKLKPRREPLPVANAVSGVQQSSPGQQTAQQQPAFSLHQKNEEDGRVRIVEGEISRAGSFKRKLSSPSASPSSKRFVREQSPISESRIPLSATGEPLEVFPGKSEQLSMDPPVIKQWLGQRHAAIAALVQREQAAKLQGRPEDDEIKFGKFKSSALVLENLSHGQLQVISVVPSSQTGSSTDSSPGKQDDTSQMDNGLRTAVDGPVNHHVYPLTGSRLQTQGFREDNVAIIPTHAGWFAWDRIHRMERQALPQLFVGKSKLQSPEIYLQVRNAIIEKYRQNPHRSLSLSDISGLNSLDDRELYRILEFLIHWGLVNYQAHPNLEKAGFKYPSKVPVYLDEDGAGALHLLPLSLTSLECLYQYEALRAPAVTNLAADSVTLDAEPVGMAEAVVKESQVPVQGLISGNCCSVCAASCSQKHYYCEKQADYFLCTDCYSDGRFGIGMTVGEFILSDGNLEPMDNSDSGSWTDQETLMLLEALEIYGENWTEISEFVGTKSKAQCISHFIGLPIEDRFLDDMEVPRAFITEGRRNASQPSCSEDTHNRGPKVLVGSEQLNQTSGTKVSAFSRCSARLDGALQEQGRFGNWGERSETEPLVAFAEAGNPVMALVAFLAAMVGPRVAAAAAHRALSSLSEDHHQASQAAVDMRDHNLAVGSERGLNSCSDVNFEISKQRTVDAGIENHTGKSRAKEEKNSEILDTMWENNSCLSTESLKKATAAALAAAAVKAKLLADQEEREVQRLAAIIVDNQLKKLDVKLKQLGEIDPALEKECEQIERNRQRLSVERARFMGTRVGATTTQSQMPVSTISSSLNIRPTGSTSGPAVPAQMLAAAAAHSSGMLRPTLFTIGPGGMAIPVSAAMVKPPS